MITLAMEEVGALDGAFNEQASPAEANRALTRLNFMLGFWSGSALMARGTIAEAFPLVAGKAAYTIGIGGDFNTSKPARVTGGAILDQYGVSTPIGTFTAEEYDGFQDKFNSPARPIGVYYDPGPTQQSSQIGIVNVYYPPDNSGPYTLYLRQDKVLISVKLADILYFEDFYFQAIMYNLAESLWRPFHSNGEPIPSDIVRHAATARAAIESLNARQQIAYTDLPGARGGGTYNIYDDMINQ